jgi:tRNA U38,U39,U40 pseudouridine synthase TruA
MARYKLILAYDGTGFNGSQRQRCKRTVQGELEVALRSLGWSERVIQMAGRTDAGVHASAQVAAFNLEWRHEDKRLLGAINARLPADLAVLELEQVPESFHPRFDARSRTYMYRLFCSSLRDPLRRTICMADWPQPNASTLDDAAALFLWPPRPVCFGSVPERREMGPHRHGLLLVHEATEWRYMVSCGHSCTGWCVAWYMYRWRRGRADAPHTLRQAIAAAGAGRPQRNCLSRPGWRRPWSDAERRALRIKWIELKTKRRVESVQDVLPQSC